MRFIRSLAGGSKGPDAGDSAGTADDAPVTASEEAREAQLTEEFESGLSELARRQLRFASHAWEPASQADRRGRWLLTQATQATAEDGRTVALRSGEALELDEPEDDEPGRVSWRFVRVRDGRTIHLGAGPDGAWPVGLERPREGA